MPALLRLGVEMKRLLLVALLTCGVGMAMATPARILLVRHAEKMDDGTRDPSLSAEGRARAEVLATLMGEHHVTDVFTSQYQRTIQTAAPGVAAHDLRATVVEAQKPAALLELVHALPPSAVALIVGHSNTVPDLAHELGAEDVAPMGEDEYDRIVILHLDPAEGEVTSRVVRYPPSS
ncbi:SixA phosphatase family protein [Synoicihabitans lomoniglobus]|uniref:Phosphoglycerate mutase family protein n=1 Tax=Synoicihabitans lomoniglobus TaxID=2909285 RepID=A0AAE9ZXC0_9BACT|nr:histidine phosphatase family protein [Opitutaceae bacterium LMO-M01]WED64959.1 phosphoglycerate mutase family protein [Opitutaceae bacterium LMO-M01]